MPGGEQIHSMRNLKKRVDFADISVNIVNLGVRDLLPAAQGISPLRVNLVIVFYI